jgi:serine phosphatase RsbU (regulator of sigma subunit)/DNA-binding NarL/FixJ family response regulator
MRSDPLATVLVVDDSEATRYVTASWLRRAGYAVVEAGTGAEALRRVAEQPIDLVVLDVNLPDVSGLDVCERIKSDPATAAVPVLHLSATAIEVSQRAMGLDRGADAYLVEPVAPEELLASVRALLRYYSARHKAERLAERLGRLTDASLRVNAASSISSLVIEAASGAAAIFDSDAVVFLSTGPGRPVAVATARAAHVEVATVGPEVLMALGGSPAAAVVLPEWQRGAWGAVLPGLGEDHPSLAVPVRNRFGTVVGGVAVNAAADVGYRRDDELLLRQFSQSLAVAVDNVLVFTEEHRIAVTMQRCLLPATLPRVPGLDIAARYIASSEQAEIGGDFFDVFELRDGSVVIAIGDVQGHSLAAATTMAELRYSLRAYAREGHPAVLVLDRLNLLMLDGHPDEIATVCYLVVSADRRTVAIANAGHIPPLLRTDATVGYLDATGPLLGMPAARPDQTVLDLTTDMLLVLVTDGLIERRDASIQVGLDRLAALVAKGARDLEPFCDRLLDELADPAGDDDIALVAVRAGSTLPPRTAAGSFMPPYRHRISGTAYK